MKKAFHISLNGHLEGTCCSGLSHGFSGPFEQDSLGREEGVFGGE